MNDYMVPGFVVLLFVMWLVILPAVLWWEHRKRH